MKEYILNLLTEAKIESEYKRYQDLLDYETYEKIVTKDPDYRNGYLGKFGHWLVKLYLALPSKDAKKRFVEEDLTKEQTQDSMKLFLRFKSQITDRTDKDLSHIKSLGDLFRIIQKYGLDVKVSKSDVKKAVEKGEDEVEVIYEDSDWKIVSLLTPESAKFYGKGTNWCTAGSDYGEEVFKNYDSKGPLYVVFHKKDTEKRYQLHPESQEYMDKYDNPVELHDLKEKVGTKAWSILGRKVFFAYFIQEFGDKFSTPISISKGLTITHFDIEKDVLSLEITPAWYHRVFNPDYSEMFYDFPDNYMEDRTEDCNKFPLSGVGLLEVFKSGEELLALEDVLDTSCYCTDVLEEIISEQEPDESVEKVKRKMFKAKILSKSLLRGIYFEGIKTKINSLNRIGEFQARFSNDFTLMVSDVRLSYVVRYLVPLNYEGQFLASCLGFLVIGRIDDDELDEIDYYPDDSYHPLYPLFEAKIRVETVVDLYYNRGQ